MASHAIAQHAACFSIMLLIPMVPNNVALVVSITLAIFSAILQYICPDMDDSLQSIEAGVNIMENSISICHVGDAKLHGQLERIRKQQFLLRARHNLWRCITSYDVFSLWLLFWQVQVVRARAQALQCRLLRDMEAEYVSQLSDNINVA
ncbi:hypothetical protein DFH05DRAFT_1291921 [Lentinula detonsa]|uniref:Uncharacterized protein n=2 Tax=Lentinula detonsa TaxID=2804962 RepID=A0A9W8NY64_9AGAR|nr:hypothetical protein DFH05DRAFT_1291921 [Lentinula detonsa]